MNPETPGRNQLSSRCRFLVSWTLTDSDYRPVGEASRYAGQDYAKVRDVLLTLMMRFRRYVESIHLPDLSIGGRALEEGMGAAFIQDNSMLHPSRSELEVGFLETQVSVVDMMNGVYDL